MGTNIKNLGLQSALAKCMLGDKINTLIATYYDHGNFGDLLARYVVEKLSGKAVYKYEEDNKYHLCTVGSVLERSEMCCNTVVWGSGFLSPQPNIKVKLTKFRQLLRGRTGMPYYLAVRGTYSREILLKAGYTCPDIYCDPGLLMPFFYHPNNIKKQYEFGIIMHMFHTPFQKCFDNIEGVKIINIERKYEDIGKFIDEMLACEYILSSSLHGLIMANAYGIPCARLVIKGALLTKSKERDNFKFRDYVSGLNACRVDKNAVAYNLNTIEIEPQVLDKGFLNNNLDMFTVPNFQIDLTPLVEAFPLLQKEYMHKKYIVSCY